jgi:hypothetical protein
VALEAVLGYVLVSRVEPGYVDDDPYARLTVTGADGKTTYVYLDGVQAHQLMVALKGLGLPACR